MLSVVGKFWRNDVLPTLDEKIEKKLTEKIKDFDGLAEQMQDQ